LHGEKGTGKGLKYVNVSQKNKGAQDVQNKKGRGEFRTREESEPKSREGGARTREFGNWGGVGTRSCRSQNKGRVRTREVGFRTREVVAAACTSGSAALPGSWETGGGRSPGPPPQTWSSPWSGALRQLEVVGKVLSLARLLMTVT